MVMQRNTFNDHHFDRNIYLSIYLSIVAQCCCCCCFFFSPKQWLMAFTIVKIQHRNRIVHILCLVIFDRGAKIHTNGQIHEMLFLLQSSNNGIFIHANDQSTLKKNNQNRIEHTLKITIYFNAHQGFEINKHSIATLKYWCVSVFIFRVCCSHGCLLNRWLFFLALSFIISLVYVHRFANEDGHL